MSDDVTILVNSCDLYEDAWYPFFYLLNEQWPGCPYKIVLNTETLNFSCDFLKVTTINSNPKFSWSKRLLNVLSKIDTEFVFFVLDDEFLLKPVNVEEFDKLIGYMKNNPDVGVIYPHKNEKQPETIGGKYFSRDLIKNAHRLVCIASVWRKDYLKKILRKHESPWEFEAYAPIRSKRYKYQILQYNKDMPDLFVYDNQLQKGYGITSRKWLPNTKKLFDSYGIKVNYDNLGWYPFTTQLEAVGSKGNKTKSNEQKGLREALYKIKRAIKCFPRRTKSMFRKLLSLI
ncbi:MAG: hypothetical protein MJ230_08130 [bacterium]|nr:hypothetical protein [bacterium]